MNLDFFAVHYGYGKGGGGDGCWGKKIKNAGVRENIRVELVESKNKLNKKRVERVIHIFGL